MSESLFQGSSVLFFSRKASVRQCAHKRIGRGERRKILFFKLLFVFVGQKLFVVLGTFAVDGGLKQSLPHLFRFSVMMGIYSQNTC